MYHYHIQKTNWSDVKMKQAGFMSIWYSIIFTFFYSIQLTKKQLTGFFIAEMYIVHFAVIVDWVLLK